MVNPSLIGTRGHTWFSKRQFPPAQSPGETPENRCELYKLEDMNGCTLVYV
jgi:hypothetical protein